jgi:predicted RND superfamily exporter protein
MNFLGRNAAGTNTKLKYGLTFLPMAAGIGTKEFYTEIEAQNLEYDDVEIVGLNLGIKEDLFNYFLKKDALWFVVAFLTIFFSMWFYTASLFLTTMTIISIFLSLEVAYFLYTMVYEIKFFPFKNLLVVVILLGIGADDVFIYSRVRTLAKLEKNAGTLEKIISDTLKHATLSMFVTSLTTSAAFFANYVSNITALKCFALFAGTVVMVNFLLMVTWIPATIVIHEKWCSQCCTCYDISRVPHLSVRNWLS